MLKPRIFSSPVNDDASKDDYLEGKVRVFSEYLGSLASGRGLDAHFDYRVWADTGSGFRLINVSIEVRCERKTYNLLRMQSRITFPYRFDVTCFGVRYPKRYSVDILSKRNAVRFVDYLFAQVQKTRKEF